MDNENLNSNNQNDINDNNNNCILIEARNENVEYDPDLKPHSGASVPKRVRAQRPVVCATVHSLTYPQSKRNKRQQSSSRIAPKQTKPSR
ncbi:hypothetical protein ACLKA7_010701 [Drosophila subpalustris]